MNSSVKDIVNIIQNSNNILIVPHVNPDGDCVGSAIALKLFLQNELNKTATLFIQSKVPDLYKFLPETDNFKTIDEINKEQFDTVIAIDCASKDRMTTAINVFDNAKITINIDHHKTNPKFAKYNYVYSNKSSAGEVLYNFSKDADWKINRDIANCLYVSILTDTGGFKFENTTADTFRTVAGLMEYGINPTLLYRCCYESKPVEMVKLSATVVSKSEFVCNGKVAYSVITLDDMKKNNALNEHTDGIVEMLRQVDSVDLAFIIKETEDGYSKISLRSKSIDVTKIASKFDGGGHSKAAGCTIKKNYSVALNKLIDAIKEETSWC